MNLTKVAKQLLINTLNNHKGDIDNKLRTNKYTMKRLVEEQTILKRQRAEIDGVISTLTKSI